MRAVVLLALLCSGCLSIAMESLLRDGIIPSLAAPERPVGRLYPEPLPTYVELVGANPDEVWARTREVLKTYGFETEQLTWTNQEGVARLRPVSLQIKGSVNTVAYTPGEIVHPLRDGERVTLTHKLVVHLSSGGTRLVRLWVDGDVRVEGGWVVQVRAPQLLAHALLDEISRGFPAVREWRIDPPPAALTPQEKRE